MYSVFYRQLRIVVVTGVFAMNVGAALAFHPGQTRSGDVPQGPHQTACENQGRQGIDRAIARDGMVHCEPVGDPDPTENVDPPQ